MANVIVEPPPSNWVKVIQDDGTEISFSIGVMKDCDEFQKIFKSEKGRICQCDRGDWWFEEGKLHMKSNFHDHRLCNKEEKLREFICDILGTMEHQDFHNYEQRLADSVRYVLPSEKDPEIITAFVEHKIQNDFAIEPLKILQ